MIKCWSNYWKVRKLVSNWDSRGTSAFEVQESVYYIMQIIYENKWWKISSDISDKIQRSDTTMRKVTTVRDKIRQIQVHLSGEWERGV